MACRKLGVMTWVHLEMVRFAKERHANACAAAFNRFTPHDTVFPGFALWLRVQELFQTADPPHTNTTKWVQRAYSTQVV